MAKTPKAVHGLLDPVWEKALREGGRRPEANCSGWRRQPAATRRFAAWDWRFYQEKLRAEKFAFDEAELKPYLQLDRIIDACFDVATRLFGITFEEKKGIAAWHPDVRVFVVKNADGSERGLFLADYFARPSKRSGAWMSALQVRLQARRRLEAGHLQHHELRQAAGGRAGAAVARRGEDAVPRIRPCAARHADRRHLAVGRRAPRFSRDFVELPSQLYEHWLTVPAVLEKHALHVKTGKPMPKALLDKMLAARTFGAGFATVEFTSSALVDMAYHARPDAPEEPLRFEAETLEKLDMPDAIAMRHRTPHFGHVFSGDGYSAGYYSYMWSEVLDADAFAAFEETGDPFNPALAERLRKNIYAAGGSKDPEELYTAFRGKMPSPDAMMVKRGLV